MNGSLTKCVDVSRDALRRVTKTMKCLFIEPGLSVGEASLDPLFRLICIPSTSLLRSHCGWPLGFELWIGVTYACRKFAHDSYMEMSALNSAWR